LTGRTGKYREKNNGGEEERVSRHTASVKSSRGEKKEGPKKLKACGKGGKKNDLRLRRGEKKSLHSPTKPSKGDAREKRKTCGRKREKHG